MLRVVVAAGVVGRLEKSLALVPVVVVQNMVLLVALLAGILTYRIASGYSVWVLTTSMTVLCSVFSFSTCVHMGFCLFSPSLFPVLL